MLWNCPECGVQNKEGMVKCVCGYELIEGDDEDNVLVYQPNWQRILIEGFLLFAGLSLVSFIKGFVLALIGSTDAIDIITKFYYVSIALEIVGFTVIGCLHRNNRFKHLTWIAIVIWILNFSSYIFVPFDLGSAIGSIFHVMIVMAIGGCLSFIFVKQNNETNLDLIRK